MPTLICRHLTFGHPGADHNLFESLDLVIDTDWRTCLSGSNGRGKTTLLKLLSGALTADRGDIEIQQPLRYFPPAVPDPAAAALAVAQDAAGPFRQWQEAMSAALASNDSAGIERYGELEQQYQAAGGYELDARLAAELDALAVPEPLHNKPFHTLSGGEQTRVLLAGLFAAEHPYALIDEPTNHLDQRGRRLLGDYLATKPGFLLVSHDRAFVDRCCDHVLALNADTVDLVATRFSQWRAQHKAQLRADAARNAHLKGEIAGFERTAATRRRGADAREAAKSGAVDKGFEGARAARQMKRALTAERRARQAADERRESLRNLEKHYPIKFSRHSRTLPAITVANGCVHRPGPLFEPVSFSLQAGTRLAISGHNGSGKTSLLEVLAGTRLNTTGTFAIPERTRIAYARQEPLWLKGTLSDHLRLAGIEEPAFRQILAALGLRGNSVDAPLQNLSHGQRKKIDLARTLSIDSDLLIWDEPLNYLDIDAREALEEAIASEQPTLVLVEHDVAFLDKVATTTLQLQSPTRG